jgi:hypothetical protein
MAKRVSITEPSQIPAALDLIHDCWFETEDVELDHGTGEMVIPFQYPLREQARSTGGMWPFKKQVTPIVRASLRIHGVDDYHLEDSSGVGRYDFNDLEYDAASRRLRITTGIPMGFEIKVRSFGLTVDVLDEIVDVRRASSLLD